MLITDQQLLFFQRCSRRTYLDVYGDFNQKDSPSDFLLKLMQDSFEFQQTILAELSYQQPDYPRGNWILAAQETFNLMKQGVEQIHKGVLLFSEEPIENVQSNFQSIEHSPQVVLLSYPDLLVKHPGLSNFGDWMYVPTDIRLGKRPKLDYQIVAAFHAYVLSQIQGTKPEQSRLILRTKGVYEVNLNQRLPQMQEILQDCIQMLQKQQEPEVFIARQKCNLCQWYNQCYTIAQSQNHLSLLPGVTPSRYSRLQALNITSVAALAETSLEFLLNYPEFNEGIAAQILQQANSTLNNQAVLRSTSENINNGKSINIQIQQTSLQSAFNPLPNLLRRSPIELYFDLEAQPELNLDYLHGVLVIDRRNNSQKFYSFLAENEAEEEKIWLEFLNLVWTYPIAPIFHFCDYEPKTIKRLAKAYNTPDYLWKPLLKRLIDIHQQVTQLVTLPVESYALKPIARWMGFEWNDPSANGAQCVYWYEQWLKTGDRTLLDTIVRYNQDDCQATFHVKEWLTNFLENVEGSQVEVPTQ
ncbi:MAG: TM0106 family RecB-like putative nuclease [Lyngbya sp.]|nr:TM0106 family RecB-like putative nuclease [Lyngbya sp.]